MKNMSAIIPTVESYKRQALRGAEVGAGFAGRTAKTAAEIDYQDATVCAQRVIGIREQAGMTSSLQDIGHTTRRHGFKDAFVTIGVLGTFWWIITAGSLASWLVGIPALASAVWVRSRLDNGANRKISIVGLIRFIPYFLYESLRGGVTVAARTLSPRVQIEPRFVHYHTALNCSSARVFFANCVSLLPGTLAADLSNDWLEVHVIGDESTALAELNKLEQAIARLYNCEPTSRPAY